MTKPRIAIVGGGIAGLVAAYEVAKTGGAEAVLYEASGRVGGKLLTTPFAGRMVDEGADAFITRVPHAIELCEELGLGDELTAPSTSGAFIWSGGALKPLPKSQMLGVPLDIEELRKSGLVSEAGIAAAEADLKRSEVEAETALAEKSLIAAADADLKRSEFAASDSKPTMGATGATNTVGALVRQRLGDEIAEKLVFPLIGSINAGNCDFLDLQTTAPLLAEAAASNPSLIAGLRNLRQQAQNKAPVSKASADRERRSFSKLPHRQNKAQVGKASADAASKGATSVFLAPKSGMDKIIRQLESRLGERIRLSSAVTSVEMLDIRFADGRASENFDAVVLATPSWAAADLLASSRPEAADQLQQIDYASVVLVTLAFNPDHPTDIELSGSGFLVPASEDLTITACSWASSKWEHLRSDQAGSKNASRDTTSQTIASRATATSRKQFQTLSSILRGQRRNRQRRLQDQKQSQPLGNILRVSLGRHGDDAIASADDEHIIATVLTDLEKTMGIRARPSETRISRWPRSFPQYAPGHSEQIAQAESLLAPHSIFLAGAGYHGIGVPACIASGRNAAQAALRQVGAAQ